MKLKVKGKRFFKELRTLYKEKNNSVSPEFDSVDNDSPETNDENVPTSPKRKVGKSSYRRTKYSKLDKTKKDAEHCFKVLGMRSFPNSNKVKLIDTLNGKVYNTHMPNITKNGYAYETRRSALSERVPSRIVGDRSSERLSRVLVSFECWGETHRRLGGGNGCSEFEFLKFMKIEQSLDSPALHSMKSTAKPIAPHYYPTCDRSLGKSATQSTERSTRFRSTKRCYPKTRPSMSTKEARLKVVLGDQA